ncbi:MAG: hypothetical protein CMI31_10545 [Opitutae bacterium]|nr:hypothetical protein [Opitutae bacterium]
MDCCPKRDSTLGEKNSCMLNEFLIRQKIRHLDDKYVVSVFTFVKEKLWGLNDKSILGKGVGWPIMKMSWKTFLARRQIGNSNS